MAVALGAAFVRGSAGSNSGDGLTNTVFAIPVKTLNVQKDILGLAKVNPSSPEGPQTVTLSFVDQTFSQIVIPEPTTVALLFAGTFGLTLMRRRN